MLKIFETEKQYCSHNYQPGSIDTDKKTYFRIATTDGYLNIHSLQLAGKKRMEVTDFLRGYRFDDSTYVK